MSAIARSHAADYLHQYGQVIAHALRNEQISAAEDEKAMRLVATALRRGARVPLFAPGEASASAADGLVAAHVRRREQAEAAPAALDGPGGPL